MEETEVEEPEVQEEQPQVEPSKNEINWKGANEALRLQRQRIEELEARLSTKQQPEPEEEDEFADLDPEDYLTIGKARQMAERLSEKKARLAAKQMVAEYAAQQSVVVDEQRMRAKYDDYDHVIDNFVLPELKANPALAYKIQQSKNPAETAYKLGLLSTDYEKSKSKTVSPKAERVMKNASRPLPASALGGDSLKSNNEDTAGMSKDDFWRLSQSYAKKAY